MLILSLRYISLLHDRKLLFLNRRGIFRGNVSTDLFGLELWLCLVGMTRIVGCLVFSSNC
jgi:hypothetical protein